MFQLTVQFENGAPPQTVAISPEETLLEALRKLGAAVDAPCGGNGTCGKCRVKIVSGTVFPAAGEDGRALACSVRARSELSILLPKETSAVQTGMKIAGASDPAALCETLENAGVCMHSAADAGYALALDIGTTTVCGILLEQKNGNILSDASCGNAQIRYGADVIHRIIEQGKPGGRQALQNAIVKDTLCPLIETLCTRAGIRASEIRRVSIAANTTMNHLLAGVNADCIRTEPYTPAFLQLPGLHASDLSLPVHPDAELLFAPNVGSYVGGDITAGVLACGLWNEDALSLFVDLGTNGELVLGNRDFLITCACSAGPAFEGGDISCGMRAMPGAIEKVRLSRDTLAPELRVIGDTKPRGLCGSGLIDTVAELFACGAIDARGRFIRSSPRIVRGCHGVGRYLLALPEESADGREIALDEVDIDNFIRAKGAVFSAIDTLLSFLELDESMLEHVYVAGGIGSAIDLKNAALVGMLPNLPQERFRYLGNTSLAGAYAIARSDAAAEKTAQLAQNMTYLELSTHPGYMDAFVAACFLPHTDQRRFPQSPSL